MMTDLLAGEEAVDLGVLAQLELTVAAVGAARAVLELALDVQHPGPHPLATDAHPKLPNEDIK